MAPVAKKPRWERKAEERPDALFEAALCVFSHKGYHATRLEEVAEAAGVSKGTIYNYFRNKEDLLKRALQNKLENHIAKAEAALDGFQGTVTDKLRFYLERGWQRWTHEDYGRFNRLISGEIAVELPDLYRLWSKEGTLKAWHLAEKIIKEGQASGEFRADADAASAARFIFSGLNHQAFLQTHMGLSKLDKVPAERILQGALDLIIRGLQSETHRAQVKPGSKKKTNSAAGKG